MPPDPEILRLRLDMTPPANLADLLALRVGALGATLLLLVIGEPTQPDAWARWRHDMLSVLARFLGHACQGPGCATCRECYATLQVLEAQKQHLVTTIQAIRRRWGWSRSPEGGGGTWRS